MILTFRCIPFDKKTLSQKKPLPNDIVNVALLIQLTIQGILIVITMVFHWSICHVNSSGHQSCFNVRHKTHHHYHKLQTTFQMLTNANLFHYCVEGFNSSVDQGLPIVCHSKWDQRWAFKNAMTKIIYHADSCLIQYKELERENPLTSS